MPKAIRKKKKFIDPKNERTTTFSLIHRSQKDPLAADDDAPQRLLQVIRESVPDQNENKNAHENSKGKQVKKQKEEEREFGVFYDDEYNYLQHLKNREIDRDWSELDEFLQDVPKATKSPGKLSDAGNSSSPTSKEGVKEITQHKSNSLPSCVFGTEGKEEQVGLLNKAAPAGLSELLEWDPDIVETLDDNFKHEVVYTLKDENKEIESDVDIEEFIAADNDNSDDEYEDVDEDIDSNFGSGGRSSDEDAEDGIGDLDRFKEFMYANEETRSRFTTYSMSSSVLKRNHHLSIVDEKFEGFMADYDDENLGGLECDEIEGVKTENSETMKQIIGEYQKIKAEERQKPPVPNESSMTHLIESIENAGDKPDMDFLEIDDRDRKKDKWDCESILSTYSNLYNRPKLISENRIMVCGKTGIPKNVLGKSGLTESALKKLNRENAEASNIKGRIKGGSETDDDSDSLDYEDTQTISSRISAISFRNKHETPEEKKTRKVAVKELKKERRAEKKANTVAFKDEKRKQEKMEMCNHKNAQVSNGKRLV